MTSAAASDAVTGPDFSALVFPALDGHAETQTGRAGDRARLEERWRARGHAAGYTEGLRAAAIAAADRAAVQAAEHEALMRTARAELGQALAVLQNAARALTERTVPVLRDAEDTLLGAAIDLAEAIVGHAVADEAAAVRFALGRSRDTATTGGPPAEPYTVRLHPLDLALLEAGQAATATGAAAQTAALPAGVTLVADAGLARGDAVSEFPDGYLDARIDSALERARAALGVVTS